MPIVHVLKGNWVRIPLFMPWNLNSFVHDDVECIYVIDTQVGVWKNLGLFGQVKTIKSFMH